MSAGSAPQEVRRARKFVVAMPVRHPQSAVTMLRLSPEQRRLMADKAFDAANLTVGALVFGKALSEREFSILLPVTGSAVSFGFVAFGVWLTRETAQ
jgi:hypothetical protein